MTCTDMREAMLVAEPRELKAIGDSELAAHLRECAECSAVANHLVAGLNALASQVKRRGAKRIRRAAVIAAVPIAAAIVGVIAVRTRDRARVPEVRPADVVSVQVAPGQQAAVFKTQDPKVTVVWLSSGGGAP
jgi:hypothetical protein